MITHDDSLPTEPFHMDASKVMLLSYHIVTEGCNQKPHYEPIRIQCVNALVDKGQYYEFSIIHNKQDLN